MKQITFYASGVHMAMPHLVSKDGTPLFGANKSPASTRAKGKTK